MILRGDTKLIKVYDITPLVDISNYDLSDAKELEEFKESVVSFLDSQEAEAVDLPEDLVGIIPDTLEIEIDDKIYTFEDVEYINKSVDELITENFNDGDLIVLFQAEGEGYFEYEENPNIEDLKVGYSACDIEDVKEDIYEYFCDLILPKIVKIKDERLELIATNFYPRDTIKADVYIVRDNILEKITEIDVMHYGWDLFEDIIQVDYDATA